MFSVVEFLLMMKLLILSKSRNLVMSERVDYENTFLLSVRLDRKKERERERISLSFKLCFLSLIFILT